MDNDISSTSTSLSNPVSEIAYLIDAALQERCHHPTENLLDAEDHDRSLATLVGLGFTAILAEGSQIQLCRPHLSTFLRYRRSRTQQPDKIDSLATAIATIVCSAIQPFRMLGFPMYYDSFVSAFFHAVDPYLAASPEARKKIKEMLCYFLEKCR